MPPSLVVTDHGPVHHFDAGSADSLIPLYHPMLALRSYYMSCSLTFGGRGGIVISADIYFCIPLRL